MHLKLLKTKCFYLTYPKVLDPEGVVGGAVGIDSGVGDLGVDGAPIVGLRGVDCVGGVRDGVIGVVADADDDDGKMQDPEPVQNSEDSFKKLSSIKGSKTKGLLNC